MQPCTYLALPATRTHLERSGAVCCNESQRPLRSSVTVARLALNQLVKVQILAPQLLGVIQPQTVFHLAAVLFLPAVAIGRQGQQPGFWLCPVPRKTRKL